MEYRDLDTSPGWWGCLWGVWATGGYGGARLPNGPERFARLLAFPNDEVCCVIKLAEPVPARDLAGTCSNYRLRYILSGVPVKAIPHWNTLGTARRA